MKSGDLNFLEPYGPLQACNGTALPFTFSFQNRRYCESSRKKPPSHIGVYLYMQSLQNIEN